METIHTGVLFGFAPNNMAPTSAGTPWLFEKMFLSLGFPYYTFCTSYKHLNFFSPGVSLSTSYPPLLTKKTEATVRVSLHCPLQLT